MPEAERTRWPWAVTTALALILLLAVALRFVGLSWGLRHPPHTDEQVYVANVVKMVQARDLDHRFYTYPALFFYLLAPVVAWLGPERWATNDAYLASRGLVALVGVLNVALAYVVGSRFFGRGAGLLAALMLAVCPVDIKTSHQVRPDILLEGLGLVALLWFRRLGTSLRGDAAAGLLIGIATAIKFTGLLMVPFYLAVRALTPGKRLAGAALAGLLTVAVPVICTPYAILHASRYASGPTHQLRMYYKPTPEKRSFGRNLAFYALEDAPQALGPIALLLVPLGIALCLRSDRRYWGAALLHPVTVFLVMSTARRVYPRLILPGMGVVFVFAAVAIAWVFGRSRVAGTVLTILAVAIPLRASIKYVNMAAHPTVTDRALDWVEAHYPEGARILETRTDANPSRDAGSMLGVDPHRYELVAASDEEDDPRDLALALSQFDLVISGPKAGPWRSALDTLQEVRLDRAPKSWTGLDPLLHDGPVALRLGEPRARPVYHAMDLATAHLNASDNASDLPALRDGDGATSWKTAGPMQGKEWIQLDLPAPAPVGRIEMYLGNEPDAYGPELAVLTTEDGSSYVPARAVDARPPIQDQVRARGMGSTRPLSQLLVLEPKRIKGIRIVQKGIRDDPWVLRELRVDALESGKDGANP